MRKVLPCFLLLVAALSGGCAMVRSDADRRQAEGELPQEGPERYELRVQAPGPLEDLLAEHLDLERFRRVPAHEGLTSEELDRLIAQAPQQADGLLRTEGYFDARVTVTREDGAGELPRVVVQVDPGPRTHIDAVDLRVAGELQRRAEEGQPDARRLRARLADDWPLPVGEPFRQEGWSGAKNATLATLHAGGYPAAQWQDTAARVRRSERRASLQAHADSGPLFHVGPLRVEGLQRYPERTVVNLVELEPGTPYSERRLLDAQDRLRQSGLFEGAVLEMETDPALAEAAPVTVRLREHALQNATLGLGYSTDTGGRATLEHVHRQPFGLSGVLRNDLEVGDLRKRWAFDARSYPRARLWQNVLSGGVERWSGPDEERFSARLRAGVAQNRARLERHYYAELQRSRVVSPLGRNTADSLAGNADFVWREVDSVLLPTRGHGGVLQTGLGHARSSAADDGPFARVLVRANHYRPFATRWHAKLRLELGQVIAGGSVAVPDPLLFRAGGVDSVRGYDFRSLGPEVNGVITSGRALLTASAEVARPILERLPALWGGVFVDAGHAARRFSELRPKVGAGVGVQYRSPVGPIRLDVAYGFDDRQVRWHLSAGVSF
jgi:translocation and assembly module TamA